MALLYGSGKLGIPRRSVGRELAGCQKLPRVSDAETSTMKSISIGSVIL